MADWQAQTLRFAWFCNASRIDPDALFSHLTGGEAEHIQRNKVPSAQNPFLAVASGSFRGLTASVQLQPGRVDFSLQPPHEDDASGLPLFDLKSALPSATPNLSSAVSSEHGLVRLAVFGSFAMPVADAHAATEIAARAAGFDLPFEDALDFQVQINRRRLPPGERFALNRIVRHEVGAYQSFVMDFSPGGGQQFAISEEKHAAIMTLDINSVPDGSFLSQVQVDSVWREMLRDFEVIFERGGLQALKG